MRRIYLDELEVGEPPSLAIGILKLVIQNESEAVSHAKILIEQARTEITEPLTQKNLTDLIETIIIHKLPLKSREEIEAMLDLQDLKQTKFYQEAFAEGEANLVLRLLHRRIGEIPQNVTERIRKLSAEQLEELGEALLDFESQEDLVNWLAR